MNLPDFRWGLIGPGRIAHRFAEAAQRLPGSRLVALTGRDPARAQAFATGWSLPDRPAVAVAPSVSALLERADLDAVYIATPHAFHGAAVQACLQAGLPVLCEKPLVPSAAEAQALVDLARQRGLFLMEALWTRFLPVYAEVAMWLQQGEIGALRVLHSSFAFHIPFDPASRAFDPAQAGGALLDIGIYNLAVSRWALAQSLGTCPPLQHVQAQAVLAPTGVDQRLSAQLQFEGGVVAQMFCAFDSHADNAFRMHGELGTIVLPQDFWQARHAELWRAGQATLTAERPFEINGFEGEVREAMRCVRAGLVESPQMPHAETLALADTMDRMRQQVGVHYPMHAARDAAA